MSSLGGVVVVILAVALLIGAALLVRYRSSYPWPAIVVAMLASGVCFTVGGDSAQDAAGPSVATVAAAITGLLSVAAAITALVPRSEDAPLSRAPTLLAVAAIVVGALGLLVNQLTS
jgi:uncharacterized membrane protein YhaH (DUF805 family)